MVGVGGWEWSLCQFGRLKKHGVGRKLTKAVHTRELRCNGYIVGYAVYERHAPIHIWNDPSQFGSRLMNLCICERESLSFMFWTIILIVQQPGGTLPRRCRKRLGLCRPVTSQPHSE